MTSGCQMSPTGPAHYEDNPPESKDMSSYAGPAQEYPFLDTLRKRFTKISPEALTEIIETYLDEASGLVDQIARGAADDEVSSVAHAAHTLKSSSALLGAASLSKLCADLESIALEGDISSAMEIVAQIQVEFPHLRAALENELRKSAETPGTSTAGG